MSSKKHFMLALAAGVLVLVVGFGLLVWPSLSSAATINARITDLDHKNRTLDQSTEEIKQLTELVEQAQAQASKSLKTVPARSLVADLMEELSMPEDGYLVTDQTFTTGREKPASMDEKVTARAVPLIVDMVARYDAVMEVIRRAESADRLVRVSSVRMHRHPERSNVEKDDEALLIASITLEAIFDPSSEEAGQR